MPANGPSAGLIESSFSQLPPGLSSADKREAGEGVCSEQKEGVSLQSCPSRSSPGPRQGERPGLGDAEPRLLRDSLLLLPGETEE